MERNLYPGIAFSPPAVLADDLGSADTVIPVSNASAFPPAPNLATIGMDEEGETVLYTAKTDGALSGCVRGVEGAARAWTAGEPIGRNFTAKDHNDLIAAVREAQETADRAHVRATEYTRRVIAVRLRDPSRPSYGLEDDGPAMAVLDVGPYTGGAEVSAIVSGVEYDAKNMSAAGDDVPDGTLILRKVED